ncbi:MAG: hypothetical protein AAF657_31180 [Acidobacteriota bacterium]
MSYHPPGAGAASQGGKTLWPLIRKDLDLQRRLTIASLVVGVVALALLSGGSGVLFYLGCVLLITVLVGHGATLAILTVVEERQQQTLPFIMSLPVTASQVAAAKIVANGLLFGVVWWMLLGGALAIIRGRGDLPDGLLVYAIIVLTEVALSTCLILMVAMATRSLPWTIGTMVCGNLVFNGFVFYLFRTSTFAAAAESSAVVWPAPAVTVLLAELVGIVLLLAAAYLLAIRRKDVL